MKQGKFGNLQQLAAEVMRQGQTAEDVVLDTREITVVTLEDKQPRIDGSHLSGQVLRPHAINQIGSHLGIHRSYIDKMRSDAPHLLDMNLNHWLHNTPARRMFRSLDGNVRAYMSDKYKRIDNAPILSTALTQIKEHSGIKVESCDVTENKMYLKVVSPKLEGEIAKGDPVQMGLVISNSEIGMGSFSIQPLIYRLVCLNGMISASDFGEGLRRRHLGARQMQGVLASADTLEAEAHAIALHARDAINQLLSPETFKQHLEAMRETTTRKIEGDVPKAVEMLGKTVGFTQDEGSGILKHLIEGGDLSQYGLLNAVTSFAQTVESYDRSTQLEELGGRIITLKPKEWKTISEAA